MLCRGIFLPLAWLFNPTLPLRQPEVVLWSYSFCFLLLLLPHRLASPLLSLAISPVPFASALPATHKSHQEQLCRLTWTSVDAGSAELRSETQGTELGFCILSLAHLVGFIVCQDPIIHQHAPGFSATLFWKGPPRGLRPGCLLDCPEPHTLRRGAVIGKGKRKREKS